MWAAHTHAPHSLRRLPRHPCQVLGNDPKRPGKEPSQDPTERPDRSDTWSRKQDQAFCSGLSSERNIGALQGH